MLLACANETARASSITSVTADNGLPARSIQWTDAAGQARSAILVDQRPQGAGYLRQLSYSVNGAARVCRGTGDNGHQGDGYVQNHTAFGGDVSSHNVPGTTTVLLAGPHHVIVAYDMPTYRISGQTVPTTVHWFFADGRSHPVFALSQDARATGGNLGADSRSPYGDMAYDGGAGAPVGGASFGDTFKFATLAANPEQVTRASGWRYDEPNTIPYAMQWVDPAQVDAEMGHVATVPITVQDQGSDPRTFPTVDIRGKQQLNGPMIDDENWAYQILNYVLPNNGPTWSKRLTWGTNWGLPGGFNNWGDGNLNPRQYSQHFTSRNGAYNGTRADGMLMTYSVWVVFGTHSGGYKEGAVGQMVKQMENAARATLSATTGAVKASGPAGVGAAVSAVVTYTPAGYNPVYATWELAAAGNAVEATLTPAAGAPLDHPVFVVHGYSAAQLPTSISVGNGLDKPGVDYLATLDPAKQQLWLTVNRRVDSPVQLKVNSAVVAPQPPAITSIPGTFQQMDTDCGGWFTGLAAHGTGRLYGRTDVGGLYRSDDHGDTWKYLSGDFTSFASLCVQGVAMAAANPDVVYQCVGVSYGGAGQGIWKSSDGGATWSHVKSGLRFSGNDPERWGGECVAVRPGNDNEVWAGSRGDGLWRSVDAGVTWTQIGSGTFPSAQFTSISLPPAGRTDVWVGASGFEGPGGVWVSVNDGANWRQITGLQAGVAAPQGCWRISRTPNGQVLVAGGNGAVGTVIYQFDAGDWSNPASYTWTDISWPGIDRSEAAPLVAALADGRIVVGSIFGGWAGGPDSRRTQVRSVAGVWSPTDALNGSMPGWQRNPPPVLIEGGRNALVQDPSDANRWFMAGGFGPFRTTDGGVTWQYLVNGVDEVVGYKVNFHPTDAQRVCLPMADHGGAVVLDGGASGAVSRYITTRGLPFPDDLGLCHVILASGDRLLGLGADQRSNWRPRIFRSADNGATWSVLAHTGLPNQENRCIISAVASRDVPDNILVSVGGPDDGAQGGVYRSTNGGSTFTRTTGLPVGADYGDQWTPNADLEIDASDHNVRYVFLKNRGLYKSTNRGAAWNIVNSGLPNYGIMAADRLRGGHLWVGICCEQPIGLSRSADGGATWSAVPGFVSVVDVDAADSRVAVLGQRTGDTHNKIYFSDDGGSTWGEITRPGHRFGNAQAIAVDPWRPGTVWISTNGRSVARFTPDVESPAPRLNLRVVAGSSGVRMVSGPGQYDRQNIALDTTANDYGWIGAGANPVTYSVTITEFPGIEHSGFQAHIFLVPNSSGSVAPDYTEPNVVMLDIQAQPDGSANGWLRYKINEPNGNSFLYGAGTLGRVTSATGAKGIWSMTLLNDTTILLNAPDGGTRTLTFPDANAIGAAFSGKVTAYFGNQPNQLSQAGQSTTFSRIQISGAPRGQPVEETFPGPALNDHPAGVTWRWLKLGASPDGIALVASEVLELSWPLPADGYALQWSPNLLPASWTELSAGAITTGANSKTAQVPLNALPAPTMAFFRLNKAQ